MNIQLCLLLTSFPLLTVGKCVLSSREFSCKGTDMEQFWLEFYGSCCEDENLVDFSINIEDSYFDVIHYFPNLPTNKNNYRVLSLTIKNSSIGHVGETALEDFTSLEMLDMSRNRLKNISFVTFLPQSIRYLYLSKNSITYVDNLFNRLRKLLHLDLSHNKIRIIDLSNVFWIRELNFSSNCVDTLIPATSGLKVVKLDLSYNKIADFNERDLKPSLNYLDISHNKLFSIQLIRHKSVLNISGNNNLTKLLAIDSGTYIETLNMPLSDSLLIANKITISRDLLNNNNKIRLLNNSIIRKFIYSRNTLIDFSNSSIIDISPYCFDELSISSVNLSLNYLKVLKHNAFSSAVIHTLDLSHSNIESVEKYTFENFTAMKIILKRNKLTTVKDIFYKVTVYDLDLSFNPLTIISNKSFVNCYELIILNFSNCFVERIENDAFFGLAELKIIDLSYNNLYILEANTFSNLPITTLILDGTRIDTIRGRAFHSLNNLKKLNLSQVGLRSLESYSFYNMSNIDVIDLRNNHIPTVPHNLFGNMDKLKAVYLDGNYITTMNPFENRLKIENYTFSFSGIFKPIKTLNLNLRYLEVKNSNIHRLKNDSFAGLFNLIGLSFENSHVGFVEGEALSNLFHLQYLDSQNLFKSTRIIKENMFKDLKRLPFLNLSHISLEGLEAKSFMGLEKLETLLLNNNNNLSQLVDDTFNGLKSLKILDLSHSNIISLNKKSFRGLKNLEILNLGFNNLLELDSKIFFKDLGNSLALHLENNNITSLHSESFIGLKNLRELYLQGNSIKDVPVGIFQDLSALTFLNLSNNLVKSLKAGSFSNLQSLVTIDLSKNQLIDLDNVDIFFSLKQLEVIRLDGNHLKQFDFKRFLINLKNVRYIGISYNKWKCEALSRIIEIMNYKNISYKADYPVYNDDNIDGVGCVDICKFVYCAPEDI